MLTTRSTARSILAFVVMATALVGGLAPPAGANTITKTDGNDTRGPLDLALLTVSHPSDAKMPQTFRFTTIGPFTNGQIDGEHGYFEVAIDDDANEEPDMRIFIVFVGGKLKGLLATPAGRVFDAVPATRHSAHSVSVKASIGRADSFDLAAFSVWLASPCAQRACVDSIPNRYPLLRHDLTAPVTTMPDLPSFTSELSPELPWPLSFSVVDDRFGSGLDRWVVQQRAVGTAGWVEVAEGTKRAPTVHISGEEGVTYDVRVLAWDQQHNRSISRSARTTVPLDDTNAALTYTGTWTPSSDEVDVFRGTLHRGTPGDEVALEVANADRVCVIGTTAPPDHDASAAVWIDGEYVKSVFEDGYTPPRSLLWCWRFGGQDVSMKITVTGLNAFALDGIAITHPEG